MTARQKGRKIYWMSTVNIPFGKMKEFHAFLEKELIPAQEKLGYHFVNGWQTIIGDIEEVTEVAESENMDACQRARANLMGSPEWTALGQKCDALTKSIHTNCAIALPHFRS